MLSIIKIYNSRFIGILLLISGLIVSNTVSILGVNFGLHPDEGVQLDLINAARASSRFYSSSFYNYPGLTNVIAHIAVLITNPGLIGNSIDVTPGQFYLQVRIIFIILSSLTCLWVFATLRTLGCNYNLSAIFGLLTIVSWQYSYHSRWIAPDLLLVQFLSLFIFVLTKAWNEEKKSWCYLAFAVSGLAASSKWQGSVAIFPAIFVLIETNTPSRRQIVRSIFVGIAIFAFVMVLVTPGIVVEFSKCLADINFERIHYSTSHGRWFGVLPYDVPSISNYLLRLARFVVYDLSSNVKIFSWLIFCLACMGMVREVQNRKKLTFTILISPVILLFTYALTNVFIVRNFLPFLPFITIFAGLGVKKTKIEHQWVFAVVMLLGFLWSISGNFMKAVDIRRGWEPVAVSELKSWVATHGHETFTFSPRVQEIMANSSGAETTGSVKCSQASQNLIFSTIEISRNNLTLRKWSGTQSGMFHIFGTSEVDFNFYSTWIWNEKFILLDPEHQRDFGVTCLNMNQGR